MGFLIIHFLVQISFFGTVLGYFSWCNFKIFHRRRTMVADIFTQSVTIKKASYGSTEIIYCSFSGSFGNIGISMYYKGNSTTHIFFIKCLEFLAQLFQNALMRSYVTEFSRILVIPPGKTSQNFCRWDYPHKKVRDGFLFW